jgi:hypothetical protein
MLHKLLLDQSSQGERDRQDIQHAQEMRNAYKILVREPEDKRQLGRPGCRWVKNILGI